MKVHLNFIKIAVLALFFTACNNTDAPENLISKEVMVELLTETQILESQVGRMNLNSYDSARVAFQYLQEKLWKENGVDSARYNESFEYYAKYPKQFTEIYQEVEDKLDALEKESREKELEQPVSVE